ncbi:phosphoglycerate mutase-like protein [Patellaria atrata CBS 101060]|uniref:Phytase A n=1 Tax=Patellaria atrata CBS 101060 TaxID=1346257 RepID=A0A9P4SJT3_9PEZI|nr:phosphoglycerate mutase-like protein [Patellaria atrata CBS 101060]
MEKQNFNRIRVPHKAGRFQSELPVHRFERSPSRKLLKEDSSLRRLWVALATITAVVFFIRHPISWLRTDISQVQRPGNPCDTRQHGYQCRPEISHYWGQYSPYFSVPSEINNTVPDTCKITFVQILSRHGARDPTAYKTIYYRNLVKKIKSDVEVFDGKYAFLKDYEYTLGEDQLSKFGEQELYDSGIKYYERYRDLAVDYMPFVRASGQDRVVMSAQYWIEGFHQAKMSDLMNKDSIKDGRHYDFVVISEAPGSNNTLNHGLCKNFESDTGHNGHLAAIAQDKYAKEAFPVIQERLERELPGLKVSSEEASYLMDLCAFETVHSPTGEISPFCDLFNEDEWRIYDWYQTLGKWYGFSHGNPLGPTQGVGFANELIARLTGKPLQDHTSTNHTLDDHPETFPLGKGHVLFADFSHDNDMTDIFSALEMFHNVPQLSNTTRMSIEETHGYSAARTVPFAARAYFEKMKCDGIDDELVRVVLNDRVLPLETCEGDSLGRCTLDNFVESLSFARHGGKWDECFD